MLNALWAGMMAAGIFWAAFHGNMGEVTNGLLDSAKEAVTLGVTMLGIMSFWCGILKIGERAGLIEALTKKMRPVIRFLFPNLPDGHPAGQYIATNMIANMLGLGWAATPAGLKAMEELGKLEHRPKVLILSSFAKGSMAELAAADDADALAGRRCGIRRRGVVRVVARETLDAADVDRIVHHAAAAVCLARVLADIAAYGREGVVLADQVHGVIVTAGTHECNVARNIHSGRAQCHTRHRMIPAEQAAAALHMGEVVIAKALHALQNHAGSLIADGAIRRILNNTGGFLDQVNGLRCCGGIQHLLEQSGQLPQTDAARNTFAAGLCMAQLQKR